MTRAHRLLKVFLATVIGAVTTCAIITALVNPYDIFRIFYHASINGNKPVADNHIRLRKAADIMRVRPRSILLGSSTVHHGIDAREVAELVPADARPLYNAGINDGGMVEILQYLKHAQLNNPELKTAIVGLDWNLFTGIKPPEPLTVPPVQALNHRWLPLETVFERTLTWTALCDSWRTIKANSGDRISSWWSILTRPSWRYSLTGLAALAASQYVSNAARAADRSAANVVFSVVTPNLSDNHIFKARSSEETKAIYFSYWMTSALSEFKASRPERLAIERSYELVQEIVDFCRDHGIALHFYISPHALSFWNFVDRSGTWDAHLEWLRRIVQLAPIWEFHSLIDFSTTPEDWFTIDVLHYNPTAGRAIISEILTRMATPGSSRFYVAPEHVEDMLKARTAALSHAKRTQSYVTEIARLLPMGKGLGWPDALPARLSPEYNGFQIVRLGGNYYGLPAGRPAYDLLDALREIVPGEQVAGTLAELLQRLSDRPAPPSR